MAGYEVNHAQLADAGKQIARHGESSAKIQSKVADANVSPKSWGLLGLEVLLPIYLAMLSDLQSHLGKMQQHLTTTGDALTDTAKAYRTLDDELAKGMRQITQQLDEGGSAIPFGGAVSA